MKLTFFSCPVTLQNKAIMLHTNTWTTLKDHRYMWKCNTPFLFPLVVFFFFYFTLPPMKSSAHFVSQRSKFLSHPRNKYNLTRHWTMVCSAYPIKRYRVNLGAGLQLTSGCKVLLLVCKPMWYSAFGCLPASSCDSRIFRVETVILLLHKCCTRLWQSPFSRDEHCLVNQNFSCDLRSISLAQLNVP